MSHNLMQPQTRAALRALAARRRRVLVARGLFALVLTLLVAMAAVAMIDRLVVMGQGVRLGLSLLAYAGVIAVVWLSSLRFLVRWPGEAELARLIEQAEPQLREDLVSAVELADDGQGLDSPAFREVLQRNVGKRVAGIDPQRVLPWKMIAWWASVSTGAVAITVVLLLTPGLRYGEMLTRAMLPTSDRDRVSSTVITLLDPSSGDDGRVPMNERVPIRVHVTGGSFDKVELEVDRGQAGRETLRFEKTRQQDEYTIELPVTDRPVRFRVAAGDGLTRYYALNPTARPRITVAAQTTTPPRYTGFDPKRTTGELGPISALAGSVVDLVLTADQPIYQAELRLELAGETSAIPLAVDPADPTRLRGSVLIDRSGDYRVYLVAADSGFDTPDAQRHEITARPDELPSVTLDQPTGSEGSARDALIRVLGKAKDDVALASVRREARVNGGAWVAVELEPNRRGRVTEAMDLMDLSLNVGDEIELRLAATDRADNTAYSESARLIVTPDGLRRLDAQALDSQNALLNALDQSAATARLYAQALEAYREAQTRNTPATTRQQRLTRVRSARLALQDNHAIAESRVIAALDLATHGKEADHFVRIGRRIAQPYALSDRTDLLGASRGQVQQLSHAAYRDAESYEHAGDLLRGSLTLATAEAADLQIDSLLQAIRRVRTGLALDDAVDPTLADKRLYRRLVGILAQTRQAQASLNATARLSQDNNLKRNAEQASKPLNESLDTIEAQVTPQSTRARLLEQMNDLERAITDTQRFTFSLLVQSQVHARRTYERKRDELPLDHTALRDLAKQLDDTSAWALTEALLARHADLEELSPDRDRVFVQDLSQAMAALDHHRQSIEFGSSAAEVNDKLTTLAQAHGTLERVHEIRVLRAMVKALGDSEAQREDNPFAGFRRRGDWQAIHARFQDVLTRLNEERDLRGVSQAINRIRSDENYRAIDREIARRNDAKHTVDPLEMELYAIVKLLDQALTEAKPFEQAARLAIAEQPPTLPARMRELADRAEDLSEQSRDAADRAEREPSAQAQRDAAELAEQQEQINRGLERVSEEIRRQADQEDLFTEEGRERSRDADDAIAMLRPDAQEAAQQLREAQTLERPDLRAQAIDQAAEAQERSAQTLRELAEHFENLEQNDPAASETRQALRESERELGIEDQLDEQYERMQRLADLAQADDAERLAQLEQILQQEPAMQRELDRIAEEMVEGARDQLADASAQEQQLADELGEQGEQAEQQRERQQQALARLAERANELERDQVRGLEDTVGREVPQARDEVQQARESLRDAADLARPNEQARQQQGDAGEQDQRIERFAQEAQQAADNINLAEDQALQERDEQRAQAQQARRDADRGIREGQPAPEAARQVVESNRAAENAEQARRAAERAARDAEQLANQAEHLARQAEREAAERDEDLGQAAQRQGQLAEQTQESADDLERAGRHQERLGNEQRAQQLQEQAEQIEQLAAQALPNAGEQIGNADRHEQGEQSAREAGEQLAEQAQRMAEQEQAAQQQGDSQQGDLQQGESQQGQPQRGESPQAESQLGNSGSAQPQLGEQPGDLGPIDQELAEQLAQELDLLDQQLAQQQASPGQPKPAQPSGQPQGQPSGQQPGDPSGEHSGEPSGQQPGQPSGEPSSDPSGQQPGQESGQSGSGQSPSSQPGGRPIDQAAMQQAENIRQQRNPNAPANQGQPGQNQPAQPAPMPGQARSDSPPNGPGSPENNGAGPGPAGDQAELGQTPEGDGDWGDLPERMVEDLNQGARERAPADYLDQVDAYFRAIAERAQQDADGRGGDR
ncbi:MAG: hypothetical protein AAGC44_08745 [Planctomycetota bacterium]